MRLAGLALGLAFCQTKTDKAVMYVCMEAGLDPSSAPVVVVVDECIGALEKRLAYTNTQKVQLSFLLFVCLCVCGGGGGRAGGSVPPIYT